MKIFLINKFLFPKGGDAISTLTTGELLKKKGHEVYFWGMKHPKNPKYEFEELFIDYIDYYKSMGFVEKLKIASKILYSFEAKKKIDPLLNKIKPDIIHLNNFAHQISPSILDVIKKYKIPTVMTMHDYKLVCPAYSMLSKGKPCEKCKNGRYYYCFLNKCTKNSYFKSLINTLEMYLHHKFLRIYNKIDIFIAPSRFMLNKVKEMGFKGEIVYLPNFVNLEEFEPNYNWEENSIVYVGRLSFEKGIKTLIEAVKGLNVGLKIIGNGPLRQESEEKVKNENIKNVKFLGFKKGKELKEEIKKAMFTVLPSECYENNPRSVIESFALGKPVVGARIGGIPELVIDHETGMTFEPGDTEDLREKIGFMLNNKDIIEKMGKNARNFVKEIFNPDSHYKKLVKSYRRAIEKSN